jgi:hypothetical protein
MEVPINTFLYFRLLHTADLQSGHKNDTRTRYDMRPYVARPRLTMWLLQKNMHNILVPRGVWFGFCTILLLFPNPFGVFQMQRRKGGRALAETRQNY